MRRAGFTLLELLLVSALVALVAAVMASALAAGFRVWQRAGSRTDESIAVALEMIARDVRNATPSRVVPFRGANGAVDIPSLVPGSERETACSYPGIVRYEHDAARRTLERVTQVFLLPEPGKEFRSTVLESVESFRLSYAAAPGEGSTAWNGEWMTSSNFPGAVRIQLVYSEGESRFERDRTILLPSR